MKSMKQDVVTYFISEDVTSTNIMEDIYFITILSVLSIKTAHTL
jgi:hypothetical protein